MKSKVLSLILRGSVVGATLTAPLLALAQESGKESVQGYITLITIFIGSTLLPFLFAIALLFFLVNTARFFIAGGNDAESQETAKRLALYGIGAFVFLISIWGIVNMLVSSFEIDDDQAKCPDYLGRWCTSKNSFGDSYYQNFDAFDAYDSGNNADRYNSETFDEESYDIVEVEGGTVEIISGVDIEGGTLEEVPPEEDETIPEPDEEAAIHNEIQNTNTGSDCIEINGSLRCSDEAPTVNISDIIGS
jgi:hypothetical protein